MPKHRGFFTRASGARAALALGLLLGLSVAASGQQAAQAPAGGERQTKADVGNSWGDLLQNVIPAATPSPALTVEQAPGTRGTSQDFLNHLFIQSTTEYIRQDIGFTGLPTNSGVFDGTPGAVADINGIPFRGAFQPNSDQVYEFMNWGTRGWLSPRVDTNFSVRYRQNLRDTEDGSPTLSLLNTFRADRRLELLSGWVQFKGLPTDGVMAGTTLTVGRQYVYGAELAAFDGASFSAKLPWYTLTLFGGRRFSYFSDPGPRAIGGGNISFPLGPSASLEYQTLFYIRGSHIFTFRKRFRENWLFNTYYKMIGGSPIDYSATVLFLPGNAKTTVRLSFFQKLTNKDFFYDYTYNARVADPYITLNRLYLGPISQYSQFVIDARRDIFPRLRAGGSIWIRRLNDFHDQGPFNTSFDDYRVHAQVYPIRKLETFVEFHQRNTNRLSPLGATQFDDVNTAGEVRVQDFTGELRRSYGEGDRVTLHGGGFFRRYSFQDRFYFINNAQMRGWLGGAQVRIDPRTRVYFDYSLDDDFFIFRPSIKKAQVLRLGLNWTY